MLPDCERLDGLPDGNVSRMGGGGGTGVVGVTVTIGVTGIGVGPILEFFGTLIVIPADSVVTPGFAACMISILALYCVAIDCQVSPDFTVWKTTHGGP